MSAGAVLRPDRTTAAEFTACIPPSLKENAAKMLALRSARIRRNVWRQPTMRRVNGLG